MKAKTAIDPGRDKKAPNCRAHSRAGWCTTVTGGVAQATNARAMKASASSRKTQVQPSGFTSHIVPPPPAISATRYQATRTPFTGPSSPFRSEEHTSELQSHHDLVCRLLLEK